MMGQKVEIENLNYRNELPGLFNRKYFLDALKKYGLESNLPISFIMGDLNGLAIIDDSLRHSIVEDIQTKLIDLDTKKRKLGQGVKLLFVLDYI